MAQDVNLRSRDTYVNALATSLLNGQSLRDVPGLLKQIINGEMWRERIVTQTGEVAKFKTFREFVEAYPPEGLHTDITFLIQLCNQFDDMEAVHMLSGAEAGGRGGANNPNGIGGKSGKIIVNVDNINIDNGRDTATGTSTAFTMRTLEKRAPEVHAEVLAGNLSPHAAMVKAGLRTPPFQMPRDPVKAGKYLAERVDAEWMLACYDAFMKASE